MAEMISVEVVTSAAPRQTQEWQLRLPAGATVADALRACGLQPDDAHHMAGIWGGPSRWRRPCERAIASTGAAP